MTTESAQEITDAVEDDKPIWLVAYEDRDQDNYTRTTLKEDYGYFTAEADAQACCDRLNKPHEDRYAAQVAEYEKRKKTWEQREAKEVEVLTLAGLGRQVGKYPVSPPRRDSWMQGKYVLVEVDSQ